jgi:hypothetical protein
MIANDRYGAGDVYELPLDRALKYPGYFVPVVREQREAWPAAVEQHRERQRLRLARSHRALPVADNVPKKPEIEPSIREARGSAPTVEELQSIRAKVQGSKPGRGEAAHHLLDHVNCTEKDTLNRLNGVFGEVYPKDLAQLRGDGKRRLKNGSSCRFCEIH